MSLFPLFSCFTWNLPVVIKWSTLFLEITQFDFAIMDSVLEFLYPKLILFVLGFWSSVATYLLHLLRYFTRFTRNGGSSKGISNDSLVVLTESVEGSLKVTESNMVFEEKQDYLQFPSLKNEKIDEKEDEKEPPEFSFTFKFSTFEEFSKNQKDLSHLLNLMEPSTVSGKNFNENIDTTEVSLEASKVDTNSDYGSRKDEFKNEVGVHEEMLVKKLQKVHDESDSSSLDLNMDSICSNSHELPTNHLQKAHEKSVDLNMNSVCSNSLDSPTSDLQKLHDESVSSSPDLNMDSIDSNNLDGFLSDGDFEVEFDEKQQNNSKKIEFLSEDDFGLKSRNTKNSLNDATNKLECLWEHQELIEQLKMEIKKVKATGLPTIFEESESPPKIMEELKPWKIEEVYQHGGGKMSEVHKFYKSYRDRMRKFDIFNYQKMYAIGFLQLKDPLPSTSSSKTFVPEITTLLSQSFTTTTKGKKHENDPTIKFIKELQSDLEVVYVGQMCLSWEILHWQYQKALAIWDSDPRGVRRFNDIADEFQQFQVLVQRFVEEEAFQGPRIQNYVKNRCVFRNLLQVPVIREDNSKNKKARNEVVYDITSDTLVEILEESIRIFWRFVRADKYKRQTPIEFQKQEDSQLFIELQKDLHKKERKLKEQLRSGNCILKKLRRFKEEETEDQVLYFFCQVDMKLVSRVLQMSRLTSDQLIWCHNKLSKVSFLNRKIHVEPSFLLFPC